MNIQLLVEGGNMKPGPAIAQKIGPLGINMGKVIAAINEATQKFKGMKVPVELEIDEKTKEFKVKTYSPPTSELLKRELNLEKGSADHKNVKVGNASIEDVIKITKMKFPEMAAKDFKKALKTILGTCASIGILVENHEPLEVVKMVEEGKYDKEINEQKTETSPEKRKELEEYLAQITKAVKEQKVETEEKSKEENKKNLNEKIS